MVAAAAAEYGGLPSSFDILFSRFSPFKRKVYLLILSVSCGVAGHRAWDPPDPFPNSAVKPRSVHGFSVVFGHANPRKLAAPLR